MVKINNNSKSTVTFNTSDLYLNCVKEKLLFVNKQNGKSFMEKGVEFIGLVKLSYQSNTGQIVPLSYHNALEDSTNKNEFNLRRCDPMYCFHNSPVDFKGFEVPTSDVGSFKEWKITQNNIFSDEEYIDLDLETYNDNYNLTQSSSQIKNIAHRQILQAAKQIEDMLIKCTDQQNLKRCSDTNKCSQNAELDGSALSITFSIDSLMQPITKAPEDREKVIFSETDLSISSNLIKCVAISKSLLHRKCENFFSSNEDYKNLNGQRNIYEDNVTESFDSAINDGENNLSIYIQELINNSIENYILEQRRKKRIKRNCKLPLTRDQNKSTSLCSVENDSLPICNSLKRLVQIIMYHRGGYAHPLYSDQNQKTSKKCKCRSHKKEKPHGDEVVFLTVPLNKLESSHAGMSSSQQNCAPKKPEIKIIEPKKKSLLKRIITGNKKKKDPVQTAVVTLGAPSHTSMTKENDNVINLKISCHRSSSDGSHVSEYSSCCKHKQKSPVKTKSASKKNEKEREVCKCNEVNSNISPNFQHACIHCNRSLHSPNICCACNSFKPHGAVHQLPTPPAITQNSHCDFCASHCLGMNHIHYVPTVFSNHSVNNINSIGVTNASMHNINKKESLKQVPPNTTSQKRKWCIFSKCKKNKRQSSQVKFKNSTPPNPENQCCKVCPSCLQNLNHLIDNKGLHGLPNIDVPRPPPTHLIVNTEENLPPSLMNPIPNNTNPKYARYDYSPNKILKNASDTSITGGKKKKCCFLKKNANTTTAVSKHDNCAACCNSKNQNRTTAEKSKTYDSNMLMSSDESCANCCLKNNSKMHDHHGSENDNIKTMSSDESCAACCLKKDSKIHDRHTVEKPKKHDSLKKPATGEKCRVCCLKRNSKSRNRVEQPKKYDSLKKEPSDEDSDLKIYTRHTTEKAKQYSSLKNMSSDSSINSAQKQTCCAINKTPKVHDRRSVLSIEVHCDCGKDEKVIKKKVSISSLTSEENDKNVLCEKTAKEKGRYCIESDTQYDISVKQNLNKPLCKPTKINKSNQKYNTIAKTRIVRHQTCGETGSNSSIYSSEHQEMVLSYKPTQSKQDNVIRARPRRNSNDLAIKSSTDSEKSQRCLLRNKFCKKKTNKSSQANFEILTYKKTSKKIKRPITRINTGIQKSYNVHETSNLTYYLHPDNGETRPVPTVAPTKSYGCFVATKPKFCRKASKERERNSDETWESGSRSSVSEKAERSDSNYVESVFRSISVQTENFCSVSCSTKNSTVKNYCPTCDTTKMLRPCMQPPHISLHVHANQPSTGTPCVNQCSKNSIKETERHFNKSVEIRTIGVNTDDLETCCNKQTEPMPRASLRILYPYKHLSLTRLQRNFANNKNEKTESSTTLILHDRQHLTLPDSYRSDVKDCIIKSLPDGKSVYTRSKHTVKRLKRKMDELEDVYFDTLQRLQGKRPRRSRCHKHVARRYNNCLNTSKTFRMTGEMPTKDKPLNRQQKILSDVAGGVELVLKKLQQLNMLMYYS